MAGAGRRSGWLEAPGPVATWVALVTMTVIWGTTWAAIRVGLAGIPPLTGAAMRFAIAGALLVLFARAIGLRLRFTGTEGRLVWVHAGLSFGVSYSITYWAEQWVPSGLTAVLFATFPLFVTLLAHVALPGERLVRHHLVGVTVGFLGVATIFSEDFERLGGPRVAIAATVMLLSPLAAAIANIVIKRWGREAHPVTLNASALGVAAGLLAGLAFWLERGRPVDLTPATVGSVVYLAVFGSAVAFVLSFWLLRHMEARRLALIALAVPVVAVALGSLAFDEPITARTVLGSALVVVGVWFATR